MQIAHVELIGDSKLSIDVNVRVNAVSVSVWPCNELVTHPGWDPVVTQ